MGINVSVIPSPVSNFGPPTVPPLFTSTPLTIYKNTITAPKIRVRRSVVNKNLSSMKDPDLGRQLRAIIETVSEIQRNLDELWAIGIEPSSFDSDGRPSHGAYCALFNGQYLQLNNPGGTGVLAVAHGLQRKPVGSVWVGLSDGVVRTILAGDDSLGVPPATKDIVFFQFKGTVTGSLAICILY